MPTIKNIYQDSLLAQASYARFDVDDGATIYAPELLQLIVQNNSGADKADLTATQAGNLAGPQGYTLLSFTSDPATGFEAALFESRAETGKYTLAIRGTAGLLDIVGADIFGVVAQGLAAAQSVSLYRYYKRLTTPRGVSVQYSQSEIEMLAAVTNRKYDGRSVTFLRASKEFQATAAGLAEGLRSDIGLGRLDANAKIDVTGHSLGGQLAQVFGALYFPDRIDHIYTYNGAGLGGSVYRVAKAFLGDRGIGLGTMSTNIVADEGLTLSAGFGYKFGPIQKLAIEAGLLVDNHSITNVTDALALYELLGQLSPDLPLESFNKILRASSNESKQGYEKTLDILRRIFLGPDIQRTEPSFRDDLAARDELYRNISDLKASASFKDFVSAGGRPYSVVSLIDSLNPAGLAQDDTDGIAYRYALQQLNPFAIVGLDYAQYNRNGEIDLYNSANGLGTITPEWLQDRARFLAWKNKKNLNDIADDNSIQRNDHGSASYVFTDHALEDSQGQNYSIQVIGSSFLQRLEPIRISFASDHGDTLQGGSYADHLYGGAGPDALTGGGGDDYLEGGAGGDTLTGDAGDDTLIGGRGVDTLIGGADNDILDGGKDDDILQGGAGNDVYLIRAGDGRDTITDHEGHNTIIYTDASGKRTVLALSAFGVAGQSNTWTGFIAGGDTVTFTRNSPLTATLPDGSQIVIDGYQDGEFGIELRDLAIDAPFAFVLVGDLEPAHIQPSLNGWNEIVGWIPQTDSLGNVITDPALPAPNNADRLFGSEGNDFIRGLGGDDEIHGGDGADRLVGGAGVDWIFGEDGDDVIEGQDATSADDGVGYLFGGAGDDWIYAATEIDVGDAIARGNAAGTELPGGWLFGGLGDDVLIGAEGQDKLAGGAGSDILIGGGGADWILGDDENRASYLDILRRADGWGSMSAYDWNHLLGPDGGTAAEDGDWIYGGGGDDVIYAGLGDDYVDGGDGDDTIFAGLGDDYVDGGDGNDKIYGGTGSDTLFGGGGDDLIGANLDGFDTSDVDYDYIDGGDGNDIILGGAGHLTLLGGAGDDQIEGGSGQGYIDGGDGNDAILVSAGSFTLLGGAGDDFIMAGSAHAYIDGGDGNDSIQGGDEPHGGAGNDILVGTPGADYLYGDDGDDLLFGYGEDWLFGGAGNDTYVFIPGSGTSYIVDDAGENRIRLMSYEIAPSELGGPDMYAPIAVGSIRFEFADGNWKLNYGNAGDCIDLGASPGGVMPAVELNHVRLGTYYDDDADPEHLSPQQAPQTTSELVSWENLAASQAATSEGGTLIAAEGLSNTLIGKEGNDIIIGGSRDDVLSGGLGNDILDGGDGSDRYVFNPGDGIDVIFDSGTQGADTLAFGPGINPDSLTLGVSGALLIRIGVSGDAIYIDGFDPDDAGTAGAIERFEFADGRVLSHAQLVSRGFDLFGTDSDDVVLGTSVADRFHASAGDDVMIGGAGDDAYYFGFGSGHDSILDEDAAPDNVDTIVLGNGITPENLGVRSSNGLLSLVVSAGDRLDIEWQPQYGSRIERVQFGDGTIWDSAMLESRAVPESSPDPASDATGGGQAPAADSALIAVGAESPKIGDASLVDAGAISATGPIQYDADAIDAFREQVADIRAGIASSTGSTRPGAATGIAFDVGVSSVAAGAVPVLAPPQSGALAARSAQSPLLSALLQSGELDALSAPAPARSTAKPIDLFSNPAGGEPAAATSGPDSLFSPLRPAQPSMQAWLDDWLGPRGRAVTASREAAAAAEIEDVHLPSTEDLVRLNPPDDIPEAQQAEALTPEEIAQSYEDIAAWLDAHPGVEQGITAAGGAAPEKNPFTFLGADAAGASDIASAAWFGQSPGMAPIGGNALQPMRGIAEGYAGLAVV